MREDEGKRKRKLHMIRDLGSTLKHNDSRTEARPKAPPMTTEEGTPALTCNPITRKSQTFPACLSESYRFINKKLGLLLGLHRPPPRRQHPTRSAGRVPTQFFSLIPTLPHGVCLGSPPAAGHESAPQRERGGGYYWYSGKGKIGCFFGWMDG